MNGTRWDADAVRDDLREYVVEHLGDKQSGVLIVDETGFLKKGEKFVGVRRLYTGTAGKRENCQIGVFAAHASEKGSALVDRELYLPHEWADDPGRRAEAGVPENVRLATKGRLARVMLERAFDAGVPARWVLADSIYGADSKFRSWLEERHKHYVLGIHKSTRVWHAGRHYQVKTLAKGLPQTYWSRISAGSGSKGERLYDWACLQLQDELADTGARRWLVVRGDIEEPQEQTFYLAFAPAGSTPDELARTAGKRWLVEATFQEVRQHLGFETQRQCSEKAIRRTAPALLALFSVVTLFAHRRMAQEGSRTIRRAAWYEKSHPTFTDALALVRKQLWAQERVTSYGSSAEAETVKVPRVFVERLIDAVCYAA